MGDFVEALKRQYGTSPFRAADVIRDLSQEDLPAPVRYALENGSAARSMGWHLSTIGQVELAHSAGKHPKLWQLKS